MSFASEKLYNGYLRRKMPTIVTKVKVKEIIVHLPCLTIHDRENIEAKRETNGNYDGMVLLLDCLKRRENWPEQFIAALDECEQKTIADEMRAEYDALRGVNGSNPSSPSTTVTRAHVHPAPPAGPLSAPAASAPPEAAAAPEPLPLENPTLPSQAPTTIAPEAVPPQSTLEVAPPPSTPPPSPESPHAQANSPQREIHTHQEPEENSEESSDFQNISVDDNVIPEQEHAGRSEASLVSMVTPPVSPHDGQGKTDTEVAATEVGPPQSRSPPPPSPPPPQEELSNGSSFLTLTPEKPPLQETTPPVDKTPAVVMETEETSEPPTTQVIEPIPQTETTSVTCSLPHPTPDDSSLCLSKPNQLISILPQNGQSPTVPEHNPPAELYSGDSERLEISQITSTNMHTVSENGVAPNHDDLEENHDNSSACQSWDTQVNVVHVSEEPSLLNLEAQITAPPPPPAQILNGEAAGNIAAPLPTFTITADSVLSLNVPFGDGVQLSDPDVTLGLKSLQDSEKDKKASRTKYMVTAAGVGAVALLMAWKYKN